MSSWPRTENVIRRPSTFTTETSKVTVKPGGVAALWVTQTPVPTDWSPGSRCGCVASMHA